MDLIRWIGAALILLAGGGFGYISARQLRREEAALQELIGIMDFLSAELECRLTPLPQLCAEAAKQGKSAVSLVFSRLCRELEGQQLPDAGHCMHRALDAVEDVPETARRHLTQLGKNLGSFDLPGQLSSLDAVRQNCQRDLLGLQSTKDTRLRGNRVLGLCAGAALVILLI